MRPRSRWRRSIASAQELNTAHSITQTTGPATQAVGAMLGGWGMAKLGYSGAPAERRERLRSRRGAVGGSRRQRDLRAIQADYCDLIAHGLAGGFGMLTAIAWAWADLS